MKSHLSDIIPVWKACEILGHDVVYRIASSFIRLKENTSGAAATRARGSNIVGSTIPTATTTTDDDIRVLVNALCYKPDNSNDDGGSRSTDYNSLGLNSSSYSNDSMYSGGPSALPRPQAPLPESVVNAWKKWVSHPGLMIENKSMFVQFVVPATVQPHPGPAGHMGLFDCWIYALQGHAIQNANPANTISNNSYYVSNNGGNSNANNPASPTIWIPDILILFAITKDYRDFRIRQKHKIIQYRRKKQQQKQTQQQQQQPEAGAVSGVVDGKSETESRNVSEEEDLTHFLDLPGTDRKIVWTMATLCYRIYDSYQKKGVVQRDTIHRFLTDVYGEDSYKQPKNKSLLDVIFAAPQNDNGLNNNVANTNNNAYLQVAVTEQQFCKRVLDTIKIDDIYNTHLLLDWIGLLACTMIPLTGKQYDSITAYIDTIQKQEAKVPVCQMYNLAEGRLYEVKRKFHSMVAKSISTFLAVIVGHPMTSDASSGVTSAPTSAQSTSSSSLPSPDSGSSGGGMKVISCQYFVQALSTSNEEVGTGGYLPSSLAKLVFLAGCTESNVHVNSFGIHDDQNAGSEGNDDYGTPSPGHVIGWGLQNVLQFGCMAVRHDTSRPHSDPDIPLLRFLFRAFQLSSRHVYSDDHPVPDKRVLTRAQVAKMLYLLAEYAVFRRHADRSPKEDIEDEEDDKNDENNASSRAIFDASDPNSFENNTQADLAACALLGLVPSDYSPKMDVDNKPGNLKKSQSKPKRQVVPLKVLVNYALSGNTAVADEMTFDEFVVWHSTKMTETGPRTRLGPLMTELRLMAAVQFGIPPVLASMEITLVAEIERRHKLRYPQTDMSRRGPRGTVWYIIDSLWFTSWANLVKKTAGTPLDAQDGRGITSNPDRTRTLNRIRNASLLVDNGSLALRPDIRWKHDYEILPPLAWSALQAWYDGGPPIYRSVVKYVSNTAPTSPHSNLSPSTRGVGATIPTENEIELYPLFVTVYLCDAASRGEARPFQQNFQLSRVSPIQVMLVQLCKELDVNPDQARLWVMGVKRASTDLISTGSMSSSSMIIDDSPSKGGPSLGDDWILGLDNSIIEQIKRRGVTSLNKDSPIILLLELKDRDSGLWPRGIDGKEWSFRRQRNNDIGNGSSALSSSEHAGGTSDLGDGIVGLYNMGNTCYLNSSIQCLSHTPIFREYFTSKAYLNDINTTNPLGHEGRLAQVTAMLINSLWKRFNLQSNDPTHHHRRITAPGSYALVTAPALTPKTFKESLSKFNDHFQGNEQHDAQELLAFLLGGLSEDLNRIVDKPYIEAPDSDGRPDSELADIWWSNHLKREMSIIVALFTGQYKSLLTCRTCKYESARFEPFSFLQVPLPEDDNLTVTLILYPIKENASVMKYCVRVRNDGKLRDVLVALAKVLHQDDLEEEEANAVIEETTQPQSSTTAAKEEDSIGTSDDDTEASNAKQAMYIRRSQNLAVVDMRDGYISKIAPNSWLLQDLQNKETGELPLLHVFELDPLPVENTNEEVSKSMPSAETQDAVAGEEESKKLEPVKPKHAYLAIAQRKSELIATEYLHPFVHRVFGTPLLLRVDDLEHCTGRQLYDIVAKRLKNVVPKSVHRFLNPKKDVKSHEEKAETEMASKALHDINSSIYRTLTDMEEVSAGPVPRYGFRLRLTTREGRRCLSCPWYEVCIGCLVPDDDKATVLMDGDSAVVDWHFAVDIATNGFGLRLSTSDFSPNLPRPVRSTSTVTVKNHSSCGTGFNKKSVLQQPGAVTLEECLDAFAKEEKIPEAYCSKCKDFRVQTKRMSIWRLPPIMIIHLKRFQFTQHMRRKLRDLVVFPIEGLDLSRIMAPATGRDGSSQKKREHRGDRSTTSAGIATGELKDDGRSEMLYDLYGVVHHQGALSGGHYVASLKSEIDGQFRLFNDAQIYEIHSRDVVDASAYILFYIRRDVAKAKLSDFWKVREEGANGLSEEDMDQLLKGRSDRCVIS